MGNTEIQIVPQLSFNAPVFLIFAGQKRLPGGVLLNKYLKKFRKVSRKTPALTLLL